MSWMPGAAADMDLNCPDVVEMVIIPRTSDIGNFEVRRALPFRNKRMVGPFIFWDQMGPGEFLSGQGLDVRPHPHIGLSTVTYLLAGSIDHKDSLGSDLRILPGDLNLMTAGSGIVHSERTGPDVRQHPSHIFGIQSWLAQPLEHENGSPAFHHIARASLPHISEKDWSGQLIIGEFAGLTSPVPTQWDTLFLNLHIQPNGRFEIPNRTEERALYVLDGHIEIGGVSYDPGQMLVLRPGDEISVKALNDVHMMLLGGAVMDGPRYIYWNFVASDKERLEQAKRDWKAGNFPKVPGDDKEFVPLPEY